MANLAYYDEEVKSFTKPYTTRLPVAMVEPLVRLICKMYPVLTTLNPDLVKIEFEASPRRFGGFYTPPPRHRCIVSPRGGYGNPFGDEKLWFNTRQFGNHVSVGIVVHEVAHMIHCHDYNLRANARANELGHVPHETVIPKERWHGPEHWAIMEYVFNHLTFRSEIEAANVG